MLFYALFYALEREQGRRERERESKGGRRDKATDASARRAKGQKSKRKESTVVMRCTRNFSSASMKAVDRRPASANASFACSAAVSTLHR